MLVGRLSRKEGTVMKNNGTFSYYVTSFFKKYLPGQKNLSTNTIHSYSDSFKLLLIFCEEKKGIKSSRLKLDDLDGILVSEFLDWLEQERGCKSTTRNQRLIALHSFCRYVQKECPMEMDTLQSVLRISYKKSEKTVVPYLTEKQMTLLLAQPEGRKWESYRDKVLMATLYDTGARVQELCDIKMKDVRITDPPIITLHGKGRKDRQVPIMGSTKLLLESYMEHYKYMPGISRGDQYLFVNQRKGKLSRWGVSHIIGKYVASAMENGLDVDFPITPHVFRHSKAVHMVRAGINLIYIRDFLGHVDCSTTEIYAKIDTEQKRKAIEKACEDIAPNQEYEDWTRDDALMEFLKSL